MIPDRFQDASAGGPIDASQRDRSDGRAYPDAFEHESGNWSVSELCRRHGVCRDTFYEWCKRKQSGDPEWFRIRSHAPLQCRQTTDKAIAAKVIAARRRFPYMGPRKLLAVLDREAPELAWPAASTIGSILKRAGLVAPVKRRRRPLDQQRSCTPAIEPNDEWSADFKGWFRTRDQQRIDPLTTTDSLSRFLMSCGLPNEHRGRPPLF